jgi:hypothetical protein
MLLTKTQYSSTSSTSYRSTDFTYFELDVFSSPQNRSKCMAGGLVVCFYAKQTVAENQAKVQTCAAAKKKT